MNAMPLDNVTEIRPLHHIKAESPMAATLLGIVKEANPEQELKAELPIDLTLPGIDNEAKPVQNSKAELPIKFTVFGITVFLQPEISVFVEVSMMALQLFRESYVVLPESTMIVCRLVQELKTHLPILVTLRGIVMEDKLMQPLKAS